MSGFEMKVEGLDEMIRNLGETGPTVNKAVAAAFYQEAEAIMSESKELVPVDTGALRSTGHVEPPQIGGDGVSVALGYGGPAAPYAERIHEDLSLNHPSGQAKYLEVPILAAQRTIRERIAESIQSNLERLLKGKR